MRILRDFAPLMFVEGTAAAAPVPEPATMTLLGIGLAMTGWRAKRRAQERGEPKAPGGRV